MEGNEITSRGISSREIGSSTQSQQQWYDS